MSHFCKKCNNYDIICQPGCKATYKPDIGNVCRDKYGAADVKSNDFYNKCMGYDKKDFLGNTPQNFWKRGEYTPKKNKNVNMNPLTWTGFPPYFDPSMFDDVKKKAGSLGSLFEFFPTKPIKKSNTIILLCIFILIIILFFNK